MVAVAVAAGEAAPGAAALAVVASAVARTFREEVWSCRSHPGTACTSPRPSAHYASHLGTAPCHARCTGGRRGRKYNGCSCYRNHQASKSRQKHRTRPGRTVYRRWARRPPADTIGPLGSPCKGSYLLHSGSTSLGRARALPSRSSRTLSPWDTVCTPRSTLRPPKGCSCPPGKAVSRGSRPDRSGPWGMGPRSAHHAESRRCCYSPHTRPSSCEACWRRVRGQTGSYVCRCSWSGSQPASCHRLCTGWAVAPLDSQIHRTSAAAHRAHMCRVALAARIIHDPCHRVRWRSQSWPGREELQWRQGQTAARYHRHHRPQSVGHYPALGLHVSQPCP